VSADVAERVEVGCYDLRGPDFDTAMIGGITASLIDADRLVRLDWRNGFPNWDMYRTVLAGDTLRIDRLRQWCVAFSVAYCSEAVQKRAYSDDLACIAGWDALHMLMASRPLEPYTVIAERLGVDPKTYKRARDGVFARLRVTLDEYWIRLGAAYRHVILAEKYY
jgi:hypothetical protein